MAKTKLNILDMDGVLVDSWQAHIQFYQEMSGRFGRALDEKAIMRAVNGLKHEFYANMGFKEEEYDIVNLAYDEEFFKYPCPVFPGVAEMLAELKAAGRNLCLATSNRKTHVRYYLRELADLFDAIMTREDSWDKSRCLRQTMARYPGANHLFIGDTRWDAKDAESAGVEFLGVSYGWPSFYKENDQENHTIVASVQELHDFLLRRGDEGEAR